MSLGNGWGIFDPSSTFRLFMRFASLVFLALLPLLAGCGGETAAPAVKTLSYEPIETPGGRMCAVQCTQAQDYCKQGCDLEYRQCVTDIQKQAIKDYESYTRQQFASHEAIELRPRDFERTSACSEERGKCAQECDGTYQGCYQTCGGKIDIRTSCQFLCF